ncbi:MAG TPA: bifunctional 4-hydroxy-2-oxoglutarate aldolase/2-dehydro-3-deoxy-phosphogluconate aldolase [Flavitalea sp.]|nr:bifunctional 4-hydroxy-2-oxoglutarate aldolase/2-dehydro-3-deoxy-phosphogluconate aldolase [Flavitalea sp.]
MKENQFFWNRFTAMPVIGIMRNFSHTDIENILTVYAKSGLNTIEITMNSTGAAESIRFATDNYGETLNVGAGTVCTEKDLDVALNAGAKFIVTPIVNIAIIERCNMLSVPVFAGAYTPTEIFTAWNAGADMVKVFPMVGNAVEYIKAVRGPLPHIKLLPTGGINIENCTEFFKAGSSGIGVGGQLFDKEYINKKNWSGLANVFASFVNKIKPVIGFK